MSYFDAEASSQSAEDIWNEVRTYYHRPEDDLVTQHMRHALELLQNHRDEKSADRVVKLREILNLPEEKEV